MTMRRVAVIFIGLTLGMITSFGLAKIQPVRAITACCCLNALPGVCDLRNVKTTCERHNEPGSGRGSLFTADPSKCDPGAASIDEINKKAAELYFTPNVPIPGLFEGSVRVDSTLLSRYVRAVYVYFVWIVGILATVMVMYGGIQWITAAGNSSKIENAKSTMNGAFIAVVLTLTSFLLLRLINPAFVRMTDLSILSVPTILLSERSESSLKGAPAVSIPRDLSNVRNVANWDDLIKTISAEVGISDPYYVKAIMMIESGGNPDAYSKKGACGLMQVLPENSGNVCLRGMANAEANLRAGINYIKFLFANTCPQRARYKSGEWTVCTPSQTSCVSNWHYVIAAYNGGPGSNCSSRDCRGQTWWECEKNVDFGATRDYVPAVETMYPIVRGWGGL